MAIGVAIDGIKRIPGTRRYNHPTLVGSHNPSNPLAATILAPFLKRDSSMACLKQFTSGL